MVITQDDSLVKSLAVSGNTLKIENASKEQLEIPANPLAEFALKNGVEYLGKRSVDLAACLASVEKAIDSAAKATN
jgi:hypothetical protein